MIHSPNTFSIKQWNTDDRPREKLLSKGKEVLSDAELIAILIGSGNRDESALGLSKRILASVENNLSILGKLSVQQLSFFKGIGEAKAISIIAALELGKRRQNENTLPTKVIKSSKHVFELLHSRIGDLQHEEFWVVYLNNANLVINTLQISKGGITQTLVDVRLVLKEALVLNATAIILVHNHPSGTLRPSKNDSAITEKIRKASLAMDINLLDHLIITTHSYYSFADEGLL